MEENKSDVEQQRETLKSQIIGLERGNAVMQCLILINILSLFIKISIYKLSKTEFRNA